MWAAEYGDELADHLPMALSALARMGANRERRDAFASTYIRAKQLRPLDPDDPERAARKGLRARMLRDGRVPVLRERLAALAPSIGAGAFHALIRLAYALADDADDEVAAALTYWEHAALDLGMSSERGEATAPFEVRSALERARVLLSHVPETLPAELIARRMAIVARDGAFDLAVGAPQLTATSLADFASITVEAFLATRNFTLLHAMTATHAMRIVLPYASEPERFLRSFWRALVAAYISAGAPALPGDTLRSEAEVVPSWDLLLATACASDDEHVVKAAFTAWSEDAVYHDMRYRPCVARYMRLIE